MLNLDIVHLIAGLGVFLFGLRQLEAGLTATASRSFKRILRARTGNALEATLTGTIATAVMQSSSVVTLMVLAFVGAGILELRNAIGIIFGSNLGTTLTGWIVATFGFKVNIEAFAFLLAGGGGLATVLLPDRGKIRSVALSITGFGLLFVGLEAMKESVESLTTMLDWQQFKDSPLIFYLLIAFCFTAIIQSSSATMVITMSALNANLLTLPAAAAVVIGADLGTTVTVILGAIAGTASSRQVAAAHFLFNLLTDVIAFALLLPLLALITGLLGITAPVYALVAFHSLFNLLGIVMMLPFYNQFAEFLQRRFSERETNAALYISRVSPEVAEAALEAMRNESCALAKQAIVWALDALDKQSSNVNGQASTQRYFGLKRIESELLTFAAQLHAQELTPEEATTFNQVLRSARSSIHAAKCIKDILPNLDEFRTSVDPSIIEFESQVCQMFMEWTTNLQVATNIDDNDQLFSDLVALLGTLQIDYDRLVLTIIDGAKTTHPDKLLSSTLLNVNRELYSSRKSLLFAVKDAWLVGQQAQDIGNVPVVHRR